jgi:protein-tyrosine phosphatase
MIMDPETNRLVLPHLYNARDMGGMMTRSGKRTAYKRFIRSDSPAALDEQSVDELIAYSVRTVIDLRSLQEMERTGNPFIHRPEILFRNIPLIAIDPEDRDDPTMGYLVENRLGHLYIMMLEHSREALVDVFRTIITAPEGAVVFHCLHGKDRTGLIAALLFLLAGVSRDDIVGNYAASFEYIRPLVDPLFKSMPENTHHMYRSDAENMRFLMDHIDAQYEGRADLYLQGLGFSERDIDKIRDRMF